MPTTRFPMTPFPERATSSPSFALRTRLLGVAASVLLASGCATKGPAEASSFALSDTYADGMVSYTVQSGDRLGDIALEFTGEVNRWKEIAASNGIDDPRSLRAGSVLRIPAELVPGSAESLAARSAERDRAAVRRGAAREVMPEATPDAGGTAVGAALAARRATPVELSPVDVNRRFDLSPLGSGTAAPNAIPRTADDKGATIDVDVTRPDAAPKRQVQVVGSYFPKGIYALPASYSRLIMRVAPGTLFEFDRQVGDWYGVVTENGVGYLREGDARLLEDTTERSTASLDAARG